MAGQTLTPQRAIRRPWRLDLRAVLSLLVTAAATGGMLLYASSLSATRALLIATHDLPAGAVLAADDLATARVRVDDAIFAAAIPAEALADLVGHQLSEPVHRQQILSRAQLSAGPRLTPDQLALTIPVKSANAAGGHLRVGDEVRVFVTRKAAGTDVDTRVVLERAQVYGVDYDDRVAITSSGAAGRTDIGPLASITLIVTAEGARALAAAVHSGDLDVALLPPSPSTPPTTPVTSGR